MEIFIVFVLGACIGSFLNVLIDRIPRGEPIFNSRSRCEFCHKKLQWYDLIPFVSFLLLKGKCRYCHKPLSWQYIGLEFLTGIVFILIYFQFESKVLNDQFDRKAFFELSYQLFMMSSFIVLFFTDLKYSILPDKIAYPAIFATSLFLLFNPSVPFHILSGIGASLFFFLLFIITRGKGMGFGDVKLVFLLGLFLGFPNIVIALYIAFLTGAFISIILIIKMKKKLKDAIPFGPFLITGAILAFFWGNSIMSFLGVV